jgi:hypothetical protein
MTEHQRFFNEDLILIVMCNVHPSQPRVILNDLARIVLREDVPIPQSPEYIEMDHTLYNFYPGKYSSNNKKLNPTLSFENAKLHITYEPWYNLNLSHIY